MIRSLQILTRTCSQRFSLIFRESHLSAVSQHTEAVWLSERLVEGHGYEEVPRLSSTETVPYSTQLSLFCLDCNNHRLKEGSFQNVLSKGSLPDRYQPIQISASENAKQVSNVGKCALVENVGQRSKVESTFSNCLTFLLQPWRRSWDFCQPWRSVICRTHFFQNHLHYRQHSVRPLTLSAHAIGVLNQTHHSSQSSSFSPQQIRTSHQAAPHIVDAWRDCLSPENENRCRQSLASNLKYYEMDKVGMGAGQKQGKNRVKWASILVSLCSVEGEPVFLFTLRSCKLKGRHKGDVSFAGGKSDPSDADVVATALREAKEELGITVAADKVWGLLKPLRDASGMKIAPVLANIGPLKDLTLKPNPGEVEEIFTLSLPHLCNPKNRAYTHFRNGDRYGFTLPVFRNGKHRVWGLTAVALDNALKVILPS